MVCCATHGSPRHTAPPLKPKASPSGPLWQRITSLILSIDGERHHRQRRLVAKAFTPRATARLQQLIVEIITELLERHLARGRCDVVCDVAEQFPIPIICALLGTPRRDWQLFSDWLTDIKKIFDWNLAADGAMHPQRLASTRRLPTRHGRSAGATR